ncbi:MAG TPA: tetratricopeptide repeat protein, partial [Vicinamibacterales bacterium]|nr:tetratricopeptide repeat protein [Vicinamibacterales bacterium]
AFKQAVAVEPRSIKAHLGLADYYWASHRVVDAEAELKRTLEIDPSSVEANRELAYFYVASSRNKEAELYLRAALRADNDSRSRFDLADYYVSLKRLDDAVAVLQETTPEGESFAPTRLRVAVIQYLAGHRVESLRIIGDVIAKEPKNALAYSLEAHVLLGEHNTQEARTAAEAAVSIDPKSARAQYALGKVELALGEPDQARKAFVEALRLEPGSAEAATELSQLHLSRHEVDSAIQFATQAVKDSPSYLEARLALVRTLSVREEDFPKAEALLRQLRQRYPASAEVQIASAELAAARHNEQSAISDYQRALRLDPDSMPALNELVDREVRTGHRAEARQALDAALAKQPDRVELLVLAGKVYASVDQMKAEKYLSRAIQIDPASIDAYAMLGGVYLTRGKLGSARDQFVELTKRQPKSIQPRTMLGILAQSQGKSEEAEGWYQKALQIDPRAAVASNNLAWLYAEQNRELGMAQELAEAAHASMPNQLEVTDTLGWVYLKRQSVARAIPLFQRCLDVEPENAGYHYHLGMAFAQNGEDRKARIELEQALKLKPDFEGAAQAKKLLQQLAY